MEYKFVETDKGTLKAKEEFTPARRYSFLVGKYENSHTAQSKLVPILIDDKNNHTLKKLEDAFSIEKVTKEFFEKYRDLFLKLKDSLDEIVKKDKKINHDFKEKGVDTVGFAKKLLGQIVFLYFLQKKGWFGVKRGREWGTGSKHFLRELFDKKHGGYNNFFNDTLEPLFYEALRQDRSYDKDYYRHFDCRIPFLNGGLFDPINDYDWVDTEILIPDEFFSNKIKTKEGDIGTGILDVFDRYNFTVKEDEPLEKEVAVDPEMLGKVFENLLEVKDRKSKGTYYTPREIVHYMCQQSLLNYLDTSLNSKCVYQEIGNEQTDIFGNKTRKQQLKLAQEHIFVRVPKEDIEMLIKFGETAIEHDTRVVNKGEETKTYSFKLPESIRKNAGEIDEALKNICVCDPAIGSGAFPVGMMNEIVRTRNALSTYFKNSERSIYAFKRHAIKNSLYGVDIDSGAIEIAKLRLWLSLIVDEDDIKKIKPLPNLDYKIVQGNSLLGVEKNLFNLKQLTDLERLKPLYFNETNVGKKQEYKRQIDGLISKITNVHKEFDFEIYFSEVFHKKKGFDVVIANPPYLRIQEIQKNDPALARSLKKKYLSASGSYDIYVCFVELAVRQMNKAGNISYILPHKFFQASFGKNLRKLISSKKLLRKIVDFGSSQVFESATTYTCLLFLSLQNDNFKFAELKPQASTNDLGVVFNDINSNDTLQSEKVDIALISNSTVTENEWHFMAGASGKLLSKLKRQPRTLADVCEKIFVGLQTSADKIYFLEHISESDGVVKAFSRSLDLEISIEREFVKPLLKGADIHRYLKPEPKIWCIFPYALADGKAILYTQKEIKNRFPLAWAWEYLVKNRKELEDRERGRMANDRFYAYIYPKNLTEFEQAKIITPDIASGCQMAIDEKGLYHTTTIYGFVFKKNCNEPLKYLLALLNSRPLWFFLTTTGSVLSGDFFRFKTNYLMPFPIPEELSPNEQTPFISLVNKILSLTESDGYLENPAKQAKVKQYEQQIDEMVYKLYNLTPEEIRVMEGINK